MVQYAENDWDCTCSKPVSRCTFWGPVLNDVRARWNERAPSSISIPDPQEEARSFFDRACSAWLRGELNQRAREAGSGKFGKLYSTLLHALRDRAEVNHVVDSSKNPLFLLPLLFNRDISVRILFLYRDLRAYLYRLRRYFHRHHHASPAPASVIYLTGLLWGKVLYRYSLLGGVENRRGRCVSYRTLVENTEETMEQICSFLDVDFDPSTLDPERPEYFSRRSNHIIGGSDVRFADQPQITSRPTWKSTLDGSERLLFRLVGGRLLNLLQESVLPFPEIGS